VGLVSLVWAIKNPGFDTGAIIRQSMLLSMSLIHSASEILSKCLIHSMSLVLSRWLIHLPGMVLSMALIHFSILLLFNPNGSFSGSGTLTGYDSFNSIGTF